MFRFFGFRAWDVGFMGFGALGRRGFGILEYIRLQGSAV